MKTSSSPTRLTNPSLRASSLLRLLPALAIALPLLATGVTPSAQAAAAGTPVLKAKTTVVGASTAGMRVTLTKRATLDGRSGPNSDIKIRGEGRLAGLILTEATVEPSRESMEVVRFGYCDKAGCEAAATSGQYVYSRSGSGGSDPENTIVLEPGTYLLYLLADDAPVTVELRLHGLAGSTVLKPRGEVHSGFVMPTAQNRTGSPGDGTFWYGEEVDVRGEAAYVIAILRMDVENWLEIFWGDCAYFEAPPPRPTAYSPACPGGVNVFQLEGGTLTKSDFARPIMSEISETDRFGYGLYYAAAAQVSDVHTAFFHLSLDSQLP